MIPFCWVLVFDLEDGPHIDDFFRTEEAANEAAEIVRVGSAHKPRVIQLFCKDE